MSTIDFVHCNKCLARPKPGKSIKIFITSCFHLFCDKCVDDDGKPCRVCGKPKKAVEMKRDVDQRILNFFQDPQKLIASKLEGLVKKHSFQMSMTKSLSSNFRKQRERLIQLQQHTQKFASIAKEKDKEIAKLKEWCEMAEPKIKELEAEKDALQREIHELKRIESRLNSGAFEPSYLFDPQNNAQPFSVTQTYDNQATEFSDAVNMNDAPQSHANISMEFLSIPMNSPAASNSSLISEVTTPKLLGIVPCEEVEENIFAPSKKTPVRPYNPYMHVVSKSRPASNVTQNQRSPFSNFSCTPNNRSSSATKRSPGNASFTPNVITSSSNIIPEVNTPSFTREF